MRLFHFTSPEHIRGCEIRGIVNGMIPMCLEPFSPKFGYQWLTSNKDFDQSWDRDKSLPYDRTAHRIEVHIPKKHLHKLLKFDTDGKKMIPKEMYEALSGYGDPESWYMYHGIILKKWLGKISDKPGGPVITPEMKGAN